MSHVLKSSFSAVAVLASALAFTACAKNSDSPKAAAAPVVTPELKADIAATSCPEIIGTFKNASGENVVYAMASVAGGVSYTVEGETTVVDGKVQQMPVNGDGAVTYVASCKDGVMTRTTRNAAGEVLQTANISVSKETGDVQAEMTANGVTEHFTMTKVSALQPKEASVPVLTAEELQPVSTDVSLPTDLSIEGEAPQAPAQPVAPSEASTPAKVDAVEAHAPQPQMPYVRGYSRGPHFPMDEQ